VIVKHRERCGAPIRAARGVTSASTILLPPPSVSPPPDP
ncbi:hypothetical protein ALC62_08175, partial [Cyphomyrmex costatus]